MAQVRTRKEKEKAQQLRLKEVEKDADGAVVQKSYSYSSTTQKNTASAGESLLRVDSRYILKDLIKTITISSILLCVVIGIYFHLRYN